MLNVHESSSIKFNPKTICWHGSNCEYRIPMRYLQIPHHIPNAYQRIENSKLLREYFCYLSQMHIYMSINLIKKIFILLGFPTKLWIRLSNDRSKFEPLLYLKKTITSLSKFWPIGAGSLKLGRLAELWKTSNGFFEI